MRPTQMLFPTLIRRAGLVAIASLLLGLLAACEDGSAEAAAEAPGEAPAAAGAVAAPPAPEVAAEPAEEPAAGPVVASDSFELRASAGESYASGELAQFGITLTGRGEWHVNQDYPFEIDIQAPEAVRLPKGELEKGDAAEFGDERAHFDVPFTPEAKGEHRVQADVSFAMCTEDTCVPEKRKVALILPVR